MSPLQLQFWHYGSFKSVNHCLLFGTNSILVGLCVLVPIVLQDFFFFPPAEYCVIKTLNIFTLCFFFFSFPHRHLSCCVGAVCGLISHGS